MNLAGYEKAFEAGLREFKAVFYGNKNRNFDGRNIPASFAIVSEVSMTHHRNSMDHKVLHTPVGPNFTHSVRLVVTPGLAPPSPLWLVGRY